MDQSQSVGRNTQHKPISIGEGEEELLGLPQFPHSQFHPLLFLTDNVTVFFAARRNFTRINHR